MIKATSEQLKVITAILTARVRGAEARAFGSRVDGNPKDYSDLDIALVGPGKLDTAVIEAVKEAFEESDLPFRVDILDWNAISEEFRKVILKKYEILPLQDESLVNKNVRL